MYFNSFTFILLFLPLVYLGYRFLVYFGKDFFAKLFLVLASLFFYGYWNIDYLYLMFMSMLVNFLIGRALREERGKKIILLLGVALNIAPLAFYKYTDFGMQTANQLLGNEFKLLELALPLAISFFTFQQIAYIVDCYRGNRAEPNFVDYCLFVGFFPQLIAGPIVHHQEVIPQFAKITSSRLSAEVLAKGVFIFAIGLFKKVVIADNLAPYVNLAYGYSFEISFLDAWLATILFYFQIYFDFSGYTDMATGAALMFNINLPVNFASPMKSRNVQEFFHRWHITLSRWLRDYLYIPLGGRGKGLSTAIRNIYITFLLGGIWHGAGWSFIIWGIIHATGFLIYQIYKSYVGRKLPLPLAWLLTFYFICYTVVYFKAETAQKGHEIALKMLGVGGIELPSSWSAWLPSFWGGIKFVGPTVLYRTNLYFIFGITALLFFVVLYYPNSNQLLARFRPRRSAAVWVAFLFFVSFITMLSSKPESFLYFHF